MNYTQRLDKLEATLGKDAIMPVVERLKWFSMFATERSCGRNNGGFYNYESPGSKPLFDSNFTENDWKWYDENAERFAQAVDGGGNNDKR